KKQTDRPSVWRQKSAPCGARKSRPKAAGVCVLSSASQIPSHTEKQVNPRRGRIYLIYRRRIRQVYDTSCDLGLRNDGKSSAYLLAIGDCTLKADATKPPTGAAMMPDLHPVHGALRMH